jgi:CheY-like chemotaxis protein
MFDVLIVDDDTDYLGLITNFLNAAGISAMPANNGELALAELMKTEFKLMITDLNMPGLSGLDVARKAIASFPGLPVILITAQGYSEVFEPAKNAGISHIITKPIDTEQFLDAINVATSGAVKARRGFC